MNQLSNLASFINSSQDSGERDKAGLQRSGPDDDAIAEGSMAEEEEQSGKVAVGRSPDEFMKMASNLGWSRNVTQISSGSSSNGGPSSNSNASLGNPEGLNLVHLPQFNFTQSLVHSNTSALTPYPSTNGTSLGESEQSAEIPDNTTSWSQFISESWNTGYLGAADMFSAAKIGVQDSRRNGTLAAIGTNLRHNPVTQAVIRNPDVVAATIGGVVGGAAGRVRVDNKIAEALRKVTSITNCQLRYKAGQDYYLQRRVTAIVLNVGTGIVMGATAAAYAVGFFV